jgi:tRNA1(Val) A37 N6-methylase TrmN6
MSLDQPNDFVKHQTLTRDAFLGGRLIVSQPAKGFRAGLDSVLLGASVAKGSATLLDLGAGAGVASLVALSHEAGLFATLVESNAGMAALGRDNIAGNDLASRAEVIEVDVTAKGALRKAAGIKTDHYQSVIANPPFFDKASGTNPGDRARADARHMAEGSLDLWIKTAAAAAAPGGEIIFVHLAEALPMLLAGFDARFGAVTVLPVAPRGGEAAMRVMVRGIKGSRAPLRLLAPFVLHEAEGRGFRPEADAIFRGAGQLNW